MLNNIYENGIILIKEEIYKEFVIKEMEYKYLMLLMEVINV